MRNNYAPGRLIPLLLFSFVITLFFEESVKAQTRYQRVYAQSQRTGSNTSIVIGSGVIEDEPQAVDKNLQTFSELTCSSLLGLGQNRWQELKFASAISRNIPVHVKLKTEIPLNILGNTSITLQAYSGNNSVGDPVTSSAGILGLVGGSDMIDYVMPAPGGSGTYDALRITLHVSGVEGVATIGIYEVYYLETPVSGIVCNEVSDYLYGVTGAAVLSGTNEVTSPENAVDGDYSTAATLRANVAVLATVFETALYSSSAVPGDSVRITFSNSAGGLLDLSLISSSFHVAAYLGNTPVNTMADQSSLLHLSLLPGSSNIQTVTFPVSSAFDRIRVSIGGGLANALGSLVLYEIERIAPKPLISAAGLFNGAIDVCAGTAVELTVSNPEVGATYNWFSSATGGNPITSGMNTNGSTFSLAGLSPGTHTYYVSVSRSGCTDEASDRAKITVNVNATPLATIAGTAAICVSSTTQSVITLTGSNGTAPYTFTYRINTGTSQTISTNSGNQVTISVPHTTPGVFAYELLGVSDSSSTACSQAATGTATVTVTAKPDPPDMSIEVNI